MSLEVLKKVVECLQQHPEKRFEPEEIVEWIFENYPDECREKQARSKAIKRPLDTDKKLKSQIVGEIVSKRSNLQNRYPKIKIIESNPKKFYFSELDDADEVREAEKDESSPTSKTDTSDPTEHDLYPKLSEFLWSELELYSKRIDNNSSKNTHGPGGNEWLHPDLVGMEDLIKDWAGEIKKCAKEYGDKKVKLWSFEVKKLINRSNVRKSFFQAVSNSSWANFGYLVAGEIQDNALKELRMLANLHGIGFIRLNADNPSESEIMIPAKERGDVNWDMANRLAKENPDFMKYIIAIHDFCLTNNHQEAYWDYKEGEEL